MAKLDIGELIDIGLAVNAGLNKAADAKSVPMTQADADKAKPVVTKEVEHQLKEQIKEVQDVVDNQLNQEPLWKSRVIRGCIATIFGTLWVAYNQYSDQGTIPFNDLYAYGVAIAGSIFTIYGRLTSKGTPTI